MGTEKISKTITTFDFRFAQTTDINKIVTLVDSAYRGNTSRTGWTTEADLIDGQRTDADEVAYLINKKNSGILLCESNNEMLASVHLEKQHDSAYIGMFAVKPDRQGSGVGKSVLMQIEDFVHYEWKCSVIYMTVITLRDELIAWYERRGYHGSGEFKAFPYGNERYGLPRRDDLRLEVLVKELNIQR